MKGIFRIGLEAYPREMRPKIAETMFEAFVRINMAYLIAHPDTPPLLRSGVRWRREGSPEQWHDIPEILKRGYDDCEGLAAWRAAEMRLKYRRPFMVRTYQSRPGLRHAIVFDPDLKRIHDPSRALGMGKKGN